MNTIQSSLQSYQFSPVFSSRIEADQRSYRKLQIKRRRQQQIRKHIMLLILSTILVCILSLLLSHSFSKASAPNSETYKYYKSVQISYGDSLWSIANKYIDNHYESVSQYIDEVKVMNCITEDAVKAGNYIIVPYYSDEFQE